MDNEFIYNELLKAYETNDIDLFDEINNKYGLGLTSIDQVEFVEVRPTIDLSKYFVNYRAQYMKNYTTSRFLVNLEPLPKYILKEPEFNIVSYSYMIFHVLTELQVNPNLDEVLDSVELEFESDLAKDILTSQGFVDVDGNGDATITGYGLMRLAGVDWVKFYEIYLDYFDFNDFERYMKEYDTGSVVKNSLNYLEEHLKIAYDKKEFNRMHDVFSSKAMIYLYEEDFKKALLEELKIFVLKLNHIFLSQDELDSYKAIEFPNINNIIELEVLSQVKSLKRILYRAWIEIDLDEMLMTKKEAYGYLVRAMDGEILDDLSDEIVDKYF